MKSRILLPIAGVTLLVLPNWLDPINLPKLIILLTATPILVWQPAQAIYANFRNFSYVQKSIILLILSAPFFALIAGVISDKKLSILFGAWGRNNGVFSLFALLLISLSFIYFVNSGGISQNLLRWSACAIGISGIYGLLQFFQLDPVQWVNSGPKLIGFFGNSNFASSIWACGAGISIFLLLIERKPVIRIFLFINYFFLTFLSYETQSIQGPLLILVFTTLAIYFWIKANHKVKTIALLALSAVGGALFMAGIFNSGPLKEFLYSTSVIARSKYWEAAWNMFKAKPLFGVGVDSYGQNYRLYRSDSAASTLTIDVTTNNAHNSLLHLLATLGIFGAGLIIIILLTTLFISVRTIISPKLHILSRIYASLFSGMFLMSLFSIDNLAVAMWLWIFLGCALGLTTFSGCFDAKKVVSKNKFSSVEIRNRISPIAAILSISIFTLSWAYAFPDRKLVEILQTPVYAADQASIMFRKDRILELSSSPLFQDQHAIISMQALNEIGIAEDAIDLGFKSLSKNPESFALMNYLAFLLEQNRRYPEAIKVREQQLVMDPRHGGVWLAIAYDARESGLVEKSSYALGQARRNSIFMGENFEKKISSFFP